jgi:hypothetical protein
VPPAQPPRPAGSSRLQKSSVVGGNGTR